MATNKKVKNDLIPLRAGVVRIIPLDAASKPIYDKAYTTNRQFLTSTQVNTTRTSETLANGNGSDKDYPTDERYTLALVTNTYDPKFHAVISGDVEATPVAILKDTTIIPANGSYVFKDGDVPVESDDGVVHMEVRDSFKNLLTDAGTSELSADTYKYDPDTKTITFDSSRDNTEISVVYYVAGTDGEAYQSSPILQSKQFRIEIYGETQSAETGQQIKYFARMLRATVSGDLPRVTTQKSISAPITYNFQSAPVPEGMSAFYESFTPDNARFQ